MNSSLDERPVGDLVKQLSEQTSTLIRQELRLAQLEMQEKGKRAGIGAGLFGGADWSRCTARRSCSPPPRWGWPRPWTRGPPRSSWASFCLWWPECLRVTGKKQVEQATPPVPEQAIDSAKRDVDEVKESARR